VVEDVVAFRAEDELDAFSDGLGLLEGDVGVNELGPIELVAGDVGSDVKGRVR
jgi:hypothetical protein